ncbi:RING/U-box superfamily protein [Euphorbia peplus]|nr:RING/U-box superfamily protein [Euphorbia peplus]
MINHTNKQYDIEAGYFTPPHATRPRTQPAQTTKLQILVVVHGEYVEKNKNNNIRVDNECSICLDEFKNEDKCGVLIGCKHVHHKDCIQEWVNKCPGVEPSCPVCRTPVCGKDVKIN